MTTDWYDEPDEADGDDMASSWGIQLDEPAPSPRPVEPPPAEEPPATLLLRSHDEEAGAEFHPRLRRAKASNTILSACPHATEERFRGLRA